MGPNACLRCEQSPASLRPQSYLEQPNSRVIAPEPRLLTKRTCSRGEGRSTARCSRNRGTRCDTHTSRLNRSGEDATGGAKHNGVLPVLGAIHSAEQPSRHADEPP